MFMAVVQREFSSGPSGQRTGQRTAGSASDRARPVHEPQVSHERTSPRTNRGRKPRRAHGHLAVHMSHRLLPLRVASLPAIAQCVIVHDKVATGRQAVWAVDSPVAGLS